jgi:hypothetical protein
MKIFTIIFAAVIFICWLNSCNSGKADNQTAANIPPSKDSLIKRGAYLVAAIGCNDCHSPKKMGPQGPEVDTTKALSGFPANGPAPVESADEQKKGLVVFSGDLTAAAGPWGTTFAANITSDATGIGNWKEAQFKNAIRHGKYMGLDAERMLMPPMPWQDLNNLSDHDIKAIFYYLKTTKPVNNVPPAFRPAMIVK